MGDSYRDMGLEDFISNFSAIESIPIEHGKKVPPYLQSPQQYQKEVVKRTVSDIPYLLTTGRGSGTVNSILLKLMYTSKVKSSSIHLAQCYLAMVPVVLGPQAVYAPVGNFSFEPHKNSFYRAVKKSGQKEPALFSDLERIYNDLYTISANWKLEKKAHGLDFEPSKHNIEQLSAIVRCAKDGNEFLSVFYKYIVSPALRIE